MGVTDELRKAFEAEWGPRDDRGEVRWETHVPLPDAPYIYQDGRRQSLEDEWAEWRPAWAAALEYVRPRAPGDHPIIAWLDAKIEEVRGE